VQVKRGRKGALPGSLPGEQTRAQLGILELERFSQASLTRWKELSGDLDELQAILYFGVRPEQRRLRGDLIAALQSQPAVEQSLVRWVRNVTYRYSMEPLSAAGSLHGYGGRFNPGADLDPDTLSPFPALYLAQDAETAFREKFQLPSTGRVDGLRPEELALAAAGSFSTVVVNGRLRNVFDMTSPQSLEPVARVLGRVKMPEAARRLRAKLEIPPRSLFMIRTGAQLFEAAVQNNWRALPAQFGLPAPSQTLAELIREASFDGILYRSSKGAGLCVAIFPDRVSADSCVELADDAPPAVTRTRLDQASGDELAGWHTLSIRVRARP
jgi:hypothetical protein